MPVLLAALLTLLVSNHAMADVRDFIGRTLLDVRVELGGASLVEPSVVQLIETRVGEPLSMERVRESIDHLVGLGRFEDIRVLADAAPGRPDGVRLRWILIPLQRIAEVEIAGRAALAEDLLRDRLDTRPP